MGVKGNRDTQTEKGTTKGHYWQTLLRRLEGGEKSRDGQNAIANQHRAGLGKDFAVGVRRFLLVSLRWEGCVRGDPTLVGICVRVIYFLNLSDHGRDTNMKIFGVKLETLNIQKHLTPKGLARLGSKVSRLWAAKE